MGEKAALPTWSSIILPVLELGSCDNLCPERRLEEKFNNNKMI